MTEAFTNLMNYASSGDIESMKEYATGLGNSVPRYEESDELKNPVMIAAARGDLPMVQYLLVHLSFPWNAIDSTGKSAGEYALENGHTNVYNWMVQHACRTEILLDVIMTKNQKPDDSIAKVINKDYLESKLTWDGERLLDDAGDAVMMGWETPLMKAHVEALDVSGSNVLNVGFGMGIIDSEIQRHSPKLHVIIEAHPDVYAMMKATGWDTKPNVRIEFGRWQDVVPKFAAEGLFFDAIFFDTFGEHYEQMQEFHEQLLDFIQIGTGRYSFFNGLAAKNVFFHDVYCLRAELELLELGLKTKWTRIEVADLERQGVWDGVARKYWDLPIYNLPLCSFD